MGLPPLSVPSESQALVVDSELSGWLVLGVASTVNVVGLRDTNGVLRCLDHGDMISHSNGQVNHSVDDALSVLEL